LSGAPWRLERGERSAVAAAAASLLALPAACEGDAADCCCGGPPAYATCRVFTFTHEFSQ
jgi:hypothetical protein